MTDWARLCSGVLLGSLGCATLLAPVAPDALPAPSVAGCVAIALGVAFVLCAVERPVHAGDEIPESPHGHDRVGGDSRSLPLLGELLVHKYRFITQKQLDQALARKREPQYIGTVLLEMGLITPAQLEQILADQARYGDPWRDLGRAEPRRQ